MNKKHGLLQQISKLLFLAIICCFFGRPSYAGIYPTLNANGNLSGFTADNVSTLLQRVSIGTDNRAYLPAQPLGILGFDIGLDFTAIPFSQDFMNQLSVVAGQTANSMPGVIVLPRLSIHKGLPFGIDLGFTYSSFSDATQSLVSAYGADIRYALIDGGVVSPSVGVRLSGNYTQLWFMNTRAYTLDVAVSKSFVFIEPYGGAGLQMWSGDLLVPVSSGLNVSNHASGLTPHFFAGAQFKIIIFRINAALDYSTSGAINYGGKISLGF